MTKTETALRRLVEYLFQIIDDIDTAGDIAKGNDQVFRRLVENYQKKRWDTGIYTDGYILDLEPAIQKFSATRIASDLEEIERKALEKRVYDKVCQDLDIVISPSVVLGTFYKVLDKIILEESEKNATAVPVSEYMTVPEAKRFIKSRLIKPTNKDLIHHKDFFISPKGQLYWAESYQHDELEGAIKIALGLQEWDWLVEEKGWVKLQSSYAARGSTNIYHIPTKYTQKQIDTLWDMAMTYKNHDKLHGDTMSHVLNKTIQKKANASEKKEAKGTRDTEVLQEEIDWDFIKDVLHDFKNTLSQVESWVPNLKKAIKNAGEDDYLEEVIDFDTVNDLLRGEGGLSGFAGNPFDSLDLDNWLQENFGEKAVEALEAKLPSRFPVKGLLETLADYEGREISLLGKDALKIVEATLKSLHFIRDGLNSFLKQAGPERFKYKGLNIYNPDLLSDGLTKEMLSYLDRLLYLLKERDLEKVFKNEIKGVTLRFATDDDGRANAYYDEDDQWIILLHRMLDKDIEPRIGKDWPLEVVVHEFGHHLHMRYLNKNAKEFWDDPWKDLERAKYLGKAYTISQEDRDYFYRKLRKYTVSTTGSVEDSFKKFIQSLKRTKEVKGYTNFYQKALAWIHSPSPSTAPLTKSPTNPTLIKEGKTLLEHLKTKGDNRHDKETFEKVFGVTTSGDYPPMTQPKEVQEILQGYKTYEKFVKALDLPTDYAAENELEDFAETFTTYLLNPKQLSLTAKYRLFRTLSLSGLHGKHVMRLSRAEKTSRIRDLSSLGLAEVTENGIHFKTGKPVTFPYMRNTEKSPHFGKRYGQHIEPAGRYLLHDDSNAVAHPLPSWEYGEIIFKKPLILEATLDEELYGPTGWKQRLVDTYKKKGKALSRALLQEGYDGIVTVHKNYTSEIVDLTVLKTKSAASESILQQR